jgi:2'-5' RNA ligase
MTTALASRFQHYYWTEFVFEPRVGHLHCTHKFLGEDVTLSEVMAVLARYFRHHRVPKFTVPFCVEEFFGPEKNIRVLCPPAGFGASHFLPELRWKLDMFAPDTYPYRPHVTTLDAKSLWEPFVAYRLMMRVKDQPAGEGYFTELVRYDLA